LLRKTLIIAVFRDSNYSLGGTNFYGHIPPGVQKRTGRALVASA
jgi:hypothetical protein